MEELLVSIARGLVEDKDAVTVTVDEPNEDGIIVYHLSVGEQDMGRVQLTDFLQRDPIVPDDLDIRLNASRELKDVIGKAVVVVNQ